uniref:Uncharacterized protein n=1 Tax=Ixodes ricinus TaxID=34613 RepID=A0A147BLA0_IXORI
MSYCEPTSLACAVIAAASHATHACPHQCIVSFVLCFLVFVLPNLGFHCAILVQTFLVLLIKVAQTLGHNSYLRLQLSRQTGWLGRGLPNVLRRQFKVKLK